MKVNTINDGLAAALGRAHAALLDDLSRLIDAARAESPASLAEMREGLAAARGHVADHFRCEEENGYMDVVRKREPRLGHAIDELAADHRRLSTALDTIIRDASTARAADEPLRIRVRVWIDELTRHELRENDLVQDAFNSDISAED